MHVSTLWRGRITRTASPVCTQLNKFNLHCNLKCFFLLCNVYFTGSSCPCKRPTYVCMYVCICACISTNANKKWNMVSTWCKYCVFDYLLQGKHFNNTRDCCIGNSFFAKSQLAGTCRAIGGPHSGAGTALAWSAPPQVDLFHLSCSWKIPVVNKYL